MTKTWTSGQTVIVVPHHILHYLPFAALVTQPDRRAQGRTRWCSPGSSSNRPLSLCYAPSLGTWDLLRSETLHPIERVGAVGLVNYVGAPSLPGVEVELRHLRSVFGARVSAMHVGEAATEANARKTLGEPGLVLLAGHGLNVADHPLESFILCHPDSGNDGRLMAADVYGMPVAADLVGLSACYSGLSSRSPLSGDDLYGLQRAFLQSGANTVVSGLWDVYDETGPELMLGLFGGLADGKTAAAALAASQRAFLERLRRSREV